MNKYIYIKSGDNLLVYERVKVEKNGIVYETLILKKKVKQLSLFKPLVLTA